MGLAHSPRIATDSIAVSVDAANPKCYPGTGTAWNSLVGSYSGSLVGSMTYSDGPAKFDTNATAITENFNLSLSPQMTLDDLSAYSFNFWVKLRSGAQATYHSLAGRGSTSPWLSLYANDTTGDSWYIRYRQSGGTYRNFSTITNYNIQNNWANICLTIETNRSINLYLNGNFIENITSATSTLFYVDRLAAGYSSGGNYYVLQGSMSIASIYSKTLSAEEVLQNFNAHRGRFGI